MYKAVVFAGFIKLCEALQGKEVLYSEFGGFHYFIVERWEGGFRLSEYKKKKPHQRRGQKVSMSWFGDRKDLQTAIQLNKEWYAKNPVTHKFDRMNQWEPFLKSFSHREFRRYEPVTAHGLPSFSYVPVEQDDGDMPNKT